MIETAQSEINSQKERAISDINNQVSELSVLIASKVLRKEISEQRSKELVEKYLKEAGINNGKGSKKYAKALFDVALDTNQLDVVYEDLETISHSSFDFIKELKAIDSNPSLTANQRKEFVERVYNEANPYVVNTLKVLADNRHISIVENVFKSFQNLYNKHYKQDFAIIESTYELSEDELSRIVELIKSKLNCQM